MAELTVVDRYLRLGLAFDRLEPGFADAYFGPTEHRAAVAAAAPPNPAHLAVDAAALARDIASDRDLAADRRDFLRAHTRALECSARKFAGEPVGFIDEVAAYFDVNIALQDTAEYERAHAAIAAILPGHGHLADRLISYRDATVVPAERLPEAVAALAGALRDIVRDRFPLPEEEIVAFEVVTDKPWSGFNYYRGSYESTVAINGDITMYLSGLPALVAHEAYPGHHTEHCRKEQRLVRSENQPEQTIFLVNTPQCLMAEGLADLALAAAVGAGWGIWAQAIYADLGLPFDGATAEQLATAMGGLLGVRQDAAIMLHDRHASDDDVVAYLRRWGLMSEKSARQTLRFISSPLWRAYISTYVEGYRLLSQWLDSPGAGEDARTSRFTRLLDEPLTPSVVRSELADSGKPVD